MCHSAGVACGSSMGLAAVLILRQQFEDAADAVLFSWASPARGFDSASLDKLARVLSASDSVCEHLCARPARSLYFDALGSGRERACTASFLRQGALLFVAVLEGSVEEGAASACVRRTAELVGGALGGAAATALGDGAGAGAGAGRGWAEGGAWRRDVEAACDAVEQ